VVSAIIPCASVLGIDRIALALADHPSHLVSSFIRLRFLLLATVLAVLSLFFSISSFRLSFRQLAREWARRVIGQGRIHVFFTLHIILEGSSGTDDLGSVPGTLMRRVSRRLLERGKSPVGMDSKGVQPSTTRFRKTSGQRGDPRPPFAVYLDCCHFNAAVASVRLRLGDTVRGL
jgi:hypothetical protein